MIMTAAELLTILQDKNSLPPISTAELEKLTQKHPYFFLGHALLAKQKSNNLLQSDNLAMAALTAGNRKMLYQFLSDKAEAFQTQAVSAEEAMPQDQMASSSINRQQDDLMDILKSIHERKQAFLNSDQPNNLRATENTKKAL